ncbi:MAG TPA: GNAT family N-acetyltransferase [Rhodothermales bacterium]|nr:GNAT family N-acetyltransferase [Rhodothermales bacterium]
MTAIRELNATDLERAGMALAQAFETDPMFQWMFTDAATRARFARQFARVPLRYGLRYGRATESNDAQAVSIWIPPERPLSMMGLIRCGMLAMPFHIGLGPYSRFLGANAVMARFHNEHASEPHWYLFVIGVCPELQGRGLGTALITEGLQRADQDGCACYLETSSERNVPYYERFGFRVVGEAPLGKNGPTGWAMRRDVP